MAVRSIASLSLTFGLVSIPVKVYLATESSAAIKFKLMAASGSRLRQQYVADPTPVQTSPLFAQTLNETEDENENENESDKEIEDRSETESKAGVQAPARGPGAVVSPFPSNNIRSVAPAVEPDVDDEPQVIERAEMVKGYEFARGQYVLFTSAELKALEAESRHTIDIVSFIPERSVDPTYYDKSYYLAPDKRGGKPYSLLHRAMQETGRCALAKWAWRAKEYVVQIRPAPGGMVLQQLLYADEVRSIDALGIELAAVGDTELKLAKQLIDQIAATSYDPHAFVDEEKQRILAAVERKVAGQQVVSHGHVDTSTSAQVVDLVAALRASLVASPNGNRAKRKPVDSLAAVPPLRERKPARRAPQPAGAKSSKARKA